MKVDELELTFVADTGRDLFLERQARLSLARQGAQSKHRPFKNSQIRFFAATLARLLQGGVPLLKALEIIRSQMRQPKAGAYVKHVMTEVREGRSLSQALSARSEVFPGYFIAMIQAGELSGTVDLVLEALSGHLEKEEATRKKIREALAYPMFVLFVGFATMLVLLKYVVPKITVLYTDFGGELPWITKAVLTVSRLAIPLSGLLILGGALVILLIRKNQHLFFSGALHLPLFGAFLRKIFLNRFCSLLALELSNGISILNALDVFVKSAHPAFQKDIYFLKEKLAEGKGFAHSLKGFSWMDEMALALIVAGEESGRLAEMLQKIHQDTICEIESHTQLLLKLVEPLLILAVGLVVGLIVLSTMLPILEINEFVR